MVGFAIVSLVSLACMLLGRFICTLISTHASPEEGSQVRWGLSGLIGLGVAGTLVYFLGLADLKLAFGAVLVVLGLMSLAAIIALRKEHRPTFEKPSSLLLVALIPLLVSLVGVLTPSTALDWDSIAYHLAVPKIWLQEGHVSSVSYIHHSNFPAAVDGLFLIGLKLGGQAGAKAFVWWFTAFGTLAIYGVLGDRFGKKSGAISALIFASIPMVIWESGTAYIDVAHGLFAGFGFYFAALHIESRKREDAILAGIMLGLAAGSKYTGLQSIGIAGLLMLIMGERKLAAQAIGIAVAVCAPWYIKNWIVVENPVYPFFYSVLGGKNWDAAAAAMYTGQQKTFGYPGIANLGNSIIGLAGNSGRFTDPQPLLGNGFAFVSLGFALLATGAAGIAKGLASKFDRSIALMIGIQLLAWTVLSQQSRYILALAIPLLALGARAIDWKPTKHLIPAGAGIQLLISLYLYNASIIQERLPVLAGGLTEQEFLEGFQASDGGRVSGKVATATLNKATKDDPAVKKIALLDEVFGFYLDKPYIWAGPGHTTEVAWAKMQTAQDLIDNFKQLGASHVYLNNQYVADLDKWNHSLTQPRSEPLAEDIRNKWRQLVGDAIHEGKLKLTQQLSRTKALYEIAQ